MTSVLLLNSPLYDDGTFDAGSLPPMGLAYLASRLSEAGIPAAVHDFVASGYDGSLTPELLDGHSHVGMNVFSTNFHLVASLIRQIPPGKEILVGGLATYPLAEAIADIKTENPLHIVRGEADLAVAAIVNHTFSGTVENPAENRFVYSIDKLGGHYPGDLDELPLNRALLADNGMVRNRYGDMEAGIITSRGCVYDCSFCAAAKSGDGRTSVRLRSRESVQGEIRELVDLNAVAVRVLDDLFLRGNDTMRAAAAMFAPTGLYWRSMAHVHSFRKTSPDILRLLRESGCRELFLGVESGSLPIIKRINKQHTPEEVVRVITGLLDAGIDVKCYFIFGFPGETMEDMEKTEALARRLKDASAKRPGNMRASAFKFRPYHGTRIYKELHGDKIILNGFKADTDLSGLVGRTEVNFTSGNFSAVAEEALTQYVKRTIDYCGRE